MIHNPNAPLPVNLKDKFVIEKKRSLIEKLQYSNWINHFKTHVLIGEINSAFDETIGNAIDAVAQAKKDKKDLGVEFFYMLFTFTNYDSLAFQIEEALIPLVPSGGSLPDGRIEKKAKTVRRNDLIVEIVTH